MNRVNAKNGFELAPLPRERIGPFLILGVSKGADAEQIEARWARCVLWARQGKTGIPLGDIHWAREVLRDDERRLEADAASLNPDVAAQELRQLERLFHLDSSKPAWAPFDPDPPAPAASDIPTLSELLGSVTAPDVQLELPGVDRWLDALAAQPIDPWSLAAPTSPPIPEPGDDA